MLITIDINTKTIFTNIIASYCSDNSFITKGINVSIVLICNYVSGSVNSYGYLCVNLEVVQPDRL